MISNEEIHLHVSHTPVLYHNHQSSEPFFPFSYCRVILAECYEETDLTSRNSYFLQKLSIVHLFTMPVGAFVPTNKKLGKLLLQVIILWYMNNQIAFWKNKFFFVFAHMSYSWIRKLNSYRKNSCVPEINILLCLGMTLVLVLTLCSNSQVHFRSYDGPVTVPKRHFGWSNLVLRLVVRT